MATIHDVAKAASVSAKTVSRVLNGDAPVNIKTRKRIETAMAELGYVPSSAARMMRSNKSGIVGLITCPTSQSRVDVSTDNAVEMSIVQGIQTALADHGKALMIADARDMPENVPGVMRTFLQYRAEGMIHVAPSLQRIEHIEMQGGTPMVLANCFDDAGTPAVLPDIQTGYRQLVHGVIRAGHRRIGRLSGPEQGIVEHLRDSGYRDALADAAIPFDPELVRIANAQSHEEDTNDLEATVSAMFGLDAPPTALCCGSDPLAMQVYGILRRRGVGVPEQMSVAGYHDQPQIAEHLFPPLTTVELCYRNVGTEAAHRLLALLDDPAPAPEAPTLISAAIHWRSSIRTTSLKDPDFDLEEE